MPGGSHEFDIHRLAALAGLTLDPGEEAALARQMDALLTFAARIQDAAAPADPADAPTDDLPPVERADRVTPSLDAATATAAAPGAEPPWFRVPRVLG